VTDRAGAKASRAAVAETEIKAGVKAAGLAAAKAAARVKGKVERTNLAGKGAEAHKKKKGGLSL